MVAAQGGDAKGLERGDALPLAPSVLDVPSERAGVLEAIDTFELGAVVVRIGGGRAAKEDTIDPRVGLTVHRRIGDAVERGDVLARVHLAAPDEGVIGRVARCFRIGDGPVSPPALVLERVGDAAA